MQQGGGSHSHYGGQPPPADAADAAAAAAQHHQHSSMVVEEASPISSRPPAPGSLDEIMPLSGGDVDVLAAAAEETERGGGGGEGTSGAGGGSGNRWPRQETLALLKIRSEMDASFRDATLKGPLWEDVSSKMGELGYRRSAKKCKEKFENVHKYYKRTKEGRAGRQDGKNYKFFSELEALHNITATTAAAMSTGPSLFPPPTVAMATAPPPSAVTTGLAAVPPVISFSNPFPISSIRIPPPAPGQPHFFAPASAPGVIIGSVAPATTSTAPMGINFLSNSSSSSPESEEDDDDDDEEEVEGQPSTTGSSRKRKRGPGESGSGVSRRKMMEFFEGLMKQVMQKQEEMQKRFFEVIEKREQDRMIREEAWRRQEMARLTREHEITAQERAASASRDAAIVSFLQKITGQTIQLPTLPTTIASAPTAASPVPPSAAAAPKSQAQPVHVSPSPQPQAVPPPTYQQPLQPSPQQQQRRQNIDVIMHPQPVSTEVIMAIPEQQVPPSQEIITGSRSSEPPSSSRWPKPEVLALIKLRSGLESRYQEAGPKGPLWEEISNGMARMGYKRSAKRCKEKWENINKYFKKVKESKKKRPEDAKTCPYFHELDALYQKKILGGYGGFRAEPSPSTAKSDAAPAAQAAPAVTQEQHQPVQTAESEHKNGGGSSGAQESIIGEGNGGENKKPEDIVKELIGQGQQLNQQLEQQQLRVNNSPSNDKGTEEDESDNLDDQEDNEEDYDEEDDDEELEEERKMAYKIEFQRQNSATPNGGGNGTPSVLAMVQ